MRTAPTAARGIPAFATYDAPVPEVQVKRTTRAEARKVLNNVRSTLKEVPRATHFNFLGLPPELRIRIYEMCVSVSEYITYDEGDFCTCGREHLSQSNAVAEHGCKYDSRNRGNFKPRLPGCFYPTAPNYIDNQKWDIPRKEYARTFKTPMPHILEVSREVRNEALPIFYAMNDFVFEDCDCFRVTHWLFNVVRPEHLEHIKSITWDGTLSWDGEMANLEDNTFVQMSSIIMLAHLKILKKCKLRLKSDLDFEDVHYACIIHEKISSLVARRSLTAAHAQNEKSKLDQLEVIGLVYCIARKLSDFCHEVNQVRSVTYRPAGLDGNSDWKCNCDCDELRKRGMIPWLGRKLLPSADGST